MFYHNTRIFFKVFAKNKIPNLIHILGLVVGMASAIVIAKYIGYSLSFDRFLPGREQIFRLRQAESGHGNAENAGDLTYRGIPIIARQALPEVINYTAFDQQVETLVMVAADQGEVISYTENKLFSVDSSFLDVFPFKALLGDPKKALSNPHSAVITQAISHKYFGAKNPIGRVITTRAPWGEEQEWTITAVLEDPPGNSSLRFDLLLAGATDGSNLWESPVYDQFIRTADAVDTRAVSRKISNMVSNQSVFKDPGRKIEVLLTPLTPSLTTFEWMLALIGWSILVLSWINFINLSIAQSSNRFREVTIKKALGSSDRQLVTQFFVESLLTNGIALLITILFLAFSYTYFAKLTGHHLLPLFDNRLYLNTLFGLVFIAGSFLTSAYPSFFLVSNKIGRLTKTGKMPGQQGWGLRSGLVVAQFAISSVMIIGAYVISAQMDYMMHKDLGFNPADKLIINPPKDRQEEKRRRMNTVKKEFAKLPWVERITTSSTIPGQSYRQEVNFTLKGSDKKSLLYINEVDTNFVSAYDMKLLAGTGFSHSGGVFANQDKTIINEVTAHALGLRPEEAVQAQLTDHENGETYTIIGVVRNYHKTSLKENLQPEIFKCNSRRGYITLNLAPDAAAHLENKIAELKTIWKTVYPDQPFEYFFLADKYDEQYAAEYFFRKIFRIFTLISVLLACLGLVGLALFEASNRKLEVGIRKTFGASSNAILVLFFKKYLFIMLIAAVIGAPVSYYFMDAWLNEYSFRIAISAWHLAAPTFLLFVIALSAISMQMIQLSGVDPARIFREE